MMNALAYYQSLPYNYDTKRAILETYFPTLTKCDSSAFGNALQKRTLEPYDVVNPLPIMMMCDKMCHTEKCPNNQRNRYYHQKCRLIHKLLQCKLCDEIVLLGKNYIRFRIGNYSFIQPRTMWQRLTSFTSTEPNEYVPQQTMNPFPYSKPPFDMFRVITYHIIAMSNKDVCKLIHND